MRRLRRRMLCSLKGDSFEGGSLEGSSFEEGSLEGGNFEKAKQTPRRQLRHESKEAASVE
jgi:hypothetical protein